MKKLWKRIPFGWKLAADLVLLLVLLGMAWALLGYPSLSAASAFRRGLRDRGLPCPDMEVLLELPREDGAGDPVGLGTDAEHCCLVYLRNDRGWQPGSAWAVPAADGVWYSPLDWWDSGWRGISLLSAGQDTPSIPAFVVKVPGVTATLTLVLEKSEIRHADGSTSRFEAGRFSLVQLAEQDGWFVFGFDTEEILRNQIIEKGSDGETIRTGWYEEPFASLTNWLRQWSVRENELSAAAHLELTVYDAVGNVVLEQSLALP